MTISQSSSSHGSKRSGSLWLSWAAAILMRWHKRRRAAAELARLAQVGDYLLRDVGLDPADVRVDPAAGIDRLTRR
jgi:uncharacterized protein YjiS (DUF1127 family)